MAADEVATKAYDKAMKAFRAACDEYHFFDCPSSGPVWDRMIRTRDELYEALGIPPPNPYADL